MLSDSNDRMVHEDVGRLYGNMMMRTRRNYRTSRASFSPFIGSYGAKMRIDKRDYHYAKKTKGGFMDLMGSTYKSRRQAAKGNAEIWFFGL